MPTTNIVTQGIQINLTGGTHAAKQVRQLSDAFNRYAQGLQKTSSQQTKTNTGMNKLSDQGLANIQAGLVQLSTYLMNVGQAIDNTFDKMQNEFMGAETAMKNLKITLGLSGLDKSMTKEWGQAGKNFELFAKRIDHYAESTQFTKKEVADAFDALIKNGIKANDAMKLLPKTLQLVSASGGKLDLGESVDITSLAVNNLGTTVQKLVTKDMDILLKTVQNSKLGFDSLRGALESMSVAQMQFRESNLKSAALMFMASSLKDIGKSGRESGQAVEQFSRSINTMVTTVSDMRLKGASKAFKRLKVKRQSMVEFFGLNDMDDFTLKQGIKSVEISNKKEIRGRYKKELQDIFIQEKLLEFSDGKWLKKSAEDTATMLLGNYQRLTGKMGEGKAGVIMQEAFGTVAPGLVVKALDEKVRKFNKTNQTNLNLMQLIQKRDKTNNETKKAQAEAMTSLANKVKKLESAEAALSNTIFATDVAGQGAVETYTELVSTTTSLMRENKGLATAVSFSGRFLQIATKVGTNFGFMLTAAATFSIALAHAQNTAKGATKGLAGVMGSFYRVFLQPTLGVVLSLGGGFIVLGILLVAFMRHISGAKGIGEGFALVLESLKQKAQALGGLFRLAFSGDTTKSLGEKVKEYQELKKSLNTLEGGVSKGQGGEDVLKKISSKRKELLKLNFILQESGISGFRALGAKGQLDPLTKAVSLIQNIYNGFKTIGESALKPLELSIGLIVDGVKIIGGIILLPLTAILKFIGAISDETSSWHFILKLIGFVIGGLVGVILPLKLAGAAIFMLRNSFNKVTGAATRWGTAAKLATEVQQPGMNRVGAKINQIGIAYGTLRGKIKVVGGELKVVTANGVADLNAMSLATTKLGGAFSNLGHRLSASSRTIGGRLKTLANVSAGMVGTVGMAMSMLGDEQTAKWGNWLMMGSMLVPMIISIFTAWTAGASTAALATFALLWPILAVITALLLVASLLSYVFTGKWDWGLFSSVKKAPKKTKKTSVTSSPGSAPDIAKGLTLPTSDTQTFASGTAPPPTTVEQNKTFHGGITFNLPSQNFKDLNEKSLRVLWEKFQKHLQNQDEQEASK